MSGDYIEQHLSVGELTIRSYAPADLEEGAWRGLQYARDAVQTFEEEFGEYPYRELDIVAVPVLAGGIEFPGIFNVANEYYTQPGGFFETIVVHETAHQWFFGLVGNNQLTEPWLDEALAQYATLRYYDAVRGERSADAFRRYLQASWTAALRARHPPSACPPTPTTNSPTAPSSTGAARSFLRRWRMRWGKIRFLRHCATTSKPTSTASPTPKLSKK